MDGIMIKKIMIVLLNTSLNSKYASIFTCYFAFILLYHYICKMV